MWGSNELCCTCCAADALQDMLAEQNAAMATLGLQVKSLQYAVDKQKYIAFINTVSTVLLPGDTHGATDEMCDVPVIHDMPGCGAACIIFSIYGMYVHSAVCILH